MSQIQKQVIYRALSEPFFAKEILSKIPMDEFKDSGYEMIVSTINLYYRTHDESLEEQSLLTLVEDKMLKQNKSLEAQNKVFEVVSDLYELENEDVDSEVISENIQNYVRKVLTREAIMKSVTNEGTLGSDSNIQQLMDDLRDILTIETAGNNSELLDFFDDVDKKMELLANLQQNKYPTGFTAIDAISDGGLARGEVGMVVAPTGGGKTTWAVNQARNYVVRGLNVLYVPLEEKVDRMIVRFEQLLSQQSKKNILVDGELNKDLYTQIQQAYGAGKEQMNWGNLWIRKYKPQELTPSGLSQLISDVMIRKGQQIDVVIIDYPDLMKNPHASGSNGESDAGGKLYEDIRAIAQEYDFVCWTLSQLNRASYGQDIKNAGAIEGSKRKMNAVELIFTLNQTSEEFSNGYLRAYVDKLRNNSGIAYDKMLYFKVLPETMTIRDETPEERAEHEALLADNAMNRASNHSDENNYTANDVNKKISNLNNTLSGGWN
uniref:DnaB-like helicase n=1 Tax=Enterococcus phage Sw5 TaxID=2950724 RepID=A0A9E7SHM8_9CAUD|nr:DnaB-like helicase [Enterococcus phage Sw5]